MTVVHECTTQCRLFAAPQRHLCHPEWQDSHPLAAVDQKHASCVPDCVQVHHTAKLAIVVTISEIDTLLCEHSTHSQCIIPPCNAHISCVFSIWNGSIGSLQLELACRLFGTMVAEQGGGLLWPLDSPTPSKNSCINEHCSSAEYQYSAMKRYLDCQRSYVTEM